MPADPQTKTYLTELEINERSVVLRPANRRKKLAQKSEEKTMAGKTLQAVLKSAITERLKAEMSDKAKATLEAAAAALEEIKGEMDEAAAEKVMAALTEALAPVEAPVEQAEEPEEEPTEEQKAEDEKVEVEKALAKNPALAARLKAIEKAAELDRTARKELEKTLALREKAEHIRTWREKTANLVGLPANLVEAGDLLAEIATLAPALAEKAATIFGAASAAVEKGLGVELGTNLSSDPNGAMAKLKALAKVKREKSEGLTDEQAFARVLSENPALYAQYEAERTAGQKAAQ